MLRSSNPDKEGRYSASKWLKVPALLESDELGDLLETLGGGGFYSTSGVVERGEITTREFLDGYKSYIEGLRAGQMPDKEETRSLFSAVWSLTEEALYRQEVGDRYLVRIATPVIQLRPHFLHYSPIDGKIRSMAPGISWGIEFSYPTFVQDGQTGAIEKVDDRYPNTGPFKVLQRWMRRRTLPVPFLAGGKRMNVPIRLGKGCFSWIGLHPELGELEVVT